MCRRSRQQAHQSIVSNPFTRVGKSGASIRLGQVETSAPTTTGKGEGMRGPFTPAPICLAIWSYYLYTLLIKNPKLQPNTQPQMEAPNLPSQPTYRIGSRLARQIRSLHMKRCIEPKKIFIDLFNAKIIQENRPGCSSSLKFF